MENIFEKFVVIGVFAGLSIDHSFYSAVVGGVVCIGIAFIIKKSLKKCNKL